jgi:hypothetical protein
LYPAERWVAGKAEEEGIAELYRPTTTPPGADRTPETAKELLTRGTRDPDGIADRLGARRWTEDVALAIADLLSDDS